MLKSVKRTPWPLQPDASYKSCTSSASQLNRGKAVFEKLVAGPSRMPKNSPLTSRERRSKQKASIRRRHDGRVGLGEPKNGLRFPNFVSVFSSFYVRSHSYRKHKLRASSSDFLLPSECPFVELISFVLCSSGMQSRDQLSPGRLLASSLLCR